VGRRKKDAMIVFVLFIFCLGSIVAEESEDYRQQLSCVREQIKQKFEEASLLVQQEGPDVRYQSLLEEVRSLKQEKAHLEEQWRKAYVQETSSGDDPYGLWDAGEIPLSQLVMEYGGNETLYIVPQELGSMKLSIFSGIPLPRESWGEMLEMVLAHNGVGVKKLNNWTKQLFILKLDPGAIEGIACREEDLALFDSHVRLAYILSPKPDQMKAIQGFFERFSDVKQTTVQSVASKVVLISSRDVIEKLVGLYRAVWEQGRGKSVRLINLTKIGAAEGERVLKAVFGEGSRGPRPPYLPGTGNAADDFSILVMPQGLILIGEAELVERGERILVDLELQLEDPSEKVVFWYACKHSNPDDIAEVLEKVYDSLIGATMEKKPEPPAPQPMPYPPTTPEVPCTFPSPNPPYNPVMPVSPTWVQPGLLPQKGGRATFGNFVVDAKTASILMVVRREELPKIKTILKKLDVPKRMVQIDVLLVERRFRDQTQCGINLLKVGSVADLPHKQGAIFDSSDVGRGLFQFLFQRSAGKENGFDLKYHFLIAQEDIRINANPSVLAINQTPATIAIVEELSINNGTIQNTLTNTVEKSFTRAQYGTTLVMVPTIHLSSFDEDPDHPGFVTMQTDVSFDTTHSNIEDRPEVTRRHIVNEVQVADGETIILGGLRRKMEEDRREKIPFLGDIPGLGKLFGFSRTRDTNTEMFIFITPRIIRDPVEDLRRIRQEDFKKRAGDLPEFLASLDEAKTRERDRLFRSSMRMLFGTPP
jgi:general secretion pathway protein D